MDIQLWDRHIIYLVVIRKILNSAYFNILDIKAEYFYITTVCIEWLFQSWISRYQSGISIFIHAEISLKQINYIKKKCRVNSKIFIFFILQYKTEVLSAITVL